MATSYDNMDPDQIVRDQIDDQIDSDELAFTDVVWLEKRMLKDRMLLEKLKGTSKNESSNQIDGDEQSRRKKMAQAQDGVLKYMLKMVDVCQAQGFVDGIVCEAGRPISGSSENLREWWAGTVGFEHNAPAALAQTPSGPGLGPNFGLS